MTKKSVPKCLEALESVQCTNGILAWIFLENHEVHFRGPVGSIKGQRLVFEPLQLRSFVLKVPWKFLLLSIEKYEGSQH